MKNKLQKGIQALLALNFNARMEATITNTNYNGDVVPMIYEILGIGNDVINQGTARLELGIREKRSIPNIRTADNPMGAYEATPTGETADTDYAERELNMVKRMLYEVINPVIWQDVWDEFASQGMTFTQVVNNPDVFRTILKLYQNAVGRQTAKDFWQGAVANPGEFNGIITRAALDASVIDVTNLGVITAANVIAVVEDVWEAIPDQFFEDPNYHIHMNTTDFKLLQTANQAAAAGSDGYLNNTVRNIFLHQRIKHYAGLPKNSIVGAKGTTGMDSNLILGFYAIPDAELGSPIINRVANNSRETFIRVDFKMDANYAEGSEIVLYQGV